MGELYVSTWLDHDVPRELVIYYSGISGSIFLPEIDIEISGLWVKQIVLQSVGGSQPIS